MQRLLTSGDADTAQRTYKRLLTETAGVTRKSRTGAGAGLVLSVAAPDGTTATEPTAVAQVLAQHFAAVTDTAASAVSDKTPPPLPYPSPALALVPGAQQRLSAGIEVAELTAALRAMANGRAVGDDGVCAELLKVAAPQLRDALCALFNRVFDAGVWPSAWASGNIVPLRKAGGKSQCANDYRPICLMSVMGKLMESVLHARLSGYLERTHALHDAQYGFRPERSTVDAAFVLAEVIAAVRERARRTAVAHTDDAHPQLPPPTASGYADVCCCALAFLDASKAYDVAWRSAIISQLKSMGVCGKMLVLLTDMLSAGKVTRTVINGTARSERFVVDAGVPQGGVLSPVLYNIFIDSLVRELNREEHGFGITIAGVRVASLHFADDIVLCAKTPEELQRMLRVCSEHARTWHFSWNPTKSKIVVVGYADARKRFTQTITGTGAGACPATLLDAAGVEQALEVVTLMAIWGLRSTSTRRPAVRIGGRLTAGHSAGQRATLRRRSSPSRTATARCRSATPSRRMARTHDRARSTLRSCGLRPSPALSASTSTRCSTSSSRSC